MYAIIKTGGKQYRVEQGDKLKVEKLDAKVGSKVFFDEVVAVGGDKLTVGNPFVKGYTVEAKVLEQGKNEKVIIYKYKAKKDYRRKNGHRQPFTLVEITKLGGEAKKETKVEAKTDNKKAAPAKKETAKKQVEKKAAPAKKAVKADASMKKDELLTIAKDMGIKVAASATKADILAAINK